DFTFTLRLIFLPRAMSSLENGRFGWRGPKPRAHGSCCARFSRVSVDERLLLARPPQRVTGAEGGRRIDGRPGIRVAQMTSPSFDTLLPHAYARRKRRRGSCDRRARLRLCQASMLAAYSRRVGRVAASPVL